MPFWNSRRIGLAVVTAIVAGGFVYWLIPSKPISERNLIRNQGYIAVVPPSNYYGPGTINTVELLGNGKISLHPTCNLDPALLIGTLESRTVESVLEQELGKGFDISARVRALLSSSTSQAATRDIHISFQNVSILTMSDEALLKLQSQLIKNHCQEAIVWNLHHGGIVCQTESVIKADVLYNIAYKETLDVNEQAKITKEIAQALQLTEASKGTNRIIGVGLFYGIRLEPNGIILNANNVMPSNCRTALQIR